MPRRSQGNFQVYTGSPREIPGILPIRPKIWLILGPNQPQTRLRAKNLTISTQFPRKNREEKRGCSREKKERKTDGVREANLLHPKLVGWECVGARAA